MRVAALLLLLLGCGESKQYDSTLDKVLDTKILVIGTEPEFKRFETKNADGEIVGFDMDMVKLLAADLGVELQIEEYEFTALIPALESRKIDLIVSGMTARPDRAESVTFTDPYFHTKLCLLVHKDSGIKTAKDANGKRFVVKQGTTGQMNMPKLFPNSPVTVLPAEADCANEVAAGKADAFLYDHLSILEASKQHANTTRAIFESLSEEPYSMAVFLGDTRFRDRINEFLGKIRADGRHKALLATWMSDLPDEIR
ncbi:MAG: transporter substrate-binding domain-containing protein [Planctomycetota bacterium]|jgi:polar amino acid transport system substrate-binding protein